MIMRVARYKRGTIESIRMYSALLLCAPNPCTPKRSITGDFVFRNSSTNTEDETHIGLYLGSGKVIHDKGRDVGVVLEGINQGGSGYWHKCGRCKLLYD